MSGQISGQVPNQGGTQFSSMSQQNIGAGSAIPSQMQNMVFSTNPDHARSIIREKITQYMQRNPITNNWLQRLPDIVRRVDDWLYKKSATKEDYMNFETLERRLHAVVRNLNNQSVARRVSSSSSVTTMIPTPGMGHTESMNLPVTCSAESSMLANSGSVVSTVGAGQLSDGYHQTLGANSFGSSGNMIVPPVSVSCGSSQMIPTPGLNNSQPLSMSAGGNGGAGYSGVESTVVSQQQHQNQLFGTQNGRMLQSFGGQLGIGLRPNMQHKHGLAVVGNNSQLGTAVSEGYINASVYSSSSRPMQQSFNQQHQPLSSTSLPRMVPVSGDVYGVPTHNMNSISSQTGPKVNISNAQTYQSSLQSIQQDVHKTSILNHSQKMDFQSPARGIQSHQNAQKFQKQPNHSYLQYSQQEFMQQQKQQNYQHLLMENNTHRQSILPSNLNNQLMTDHAMESDNETLLSQLSDEYRLSELTHFQQNNVADINLAGARLVGQLSGSQNIRPSISRCSQEIHQIFHPSQQSVESQNGFYSFPTGSHLEALQQGQWHPQSLQKTHIIDNSSFEQHIQDEFQQRILIQDEAQHPQEGQSSSVANEVTETKNSNLLSSNDNKRNHDYKNQRRWLLFLRHACHCSAPKGKCQEVHCILAQQLLAHMKRCKLDNCSYPRCQASKRLIKHHHNCTDKSCPVCVYVREFVAAHRMQRLSPESALVRQVNGSWKAVNAVHVDKTESKSNIPTTETTFEQLQTPLKRIKVEHPMCDIPKNESSSLSVSEKNQLHASDEQLMQGYQPGDADSSAKIETADDVIESQNRAVLKGIDFTDDDTCGFTMQSDLHTVASSFTKKQENEQIVKDQPKVDVKSEANALSIDPVSGKSGKPKIKGVSLTELFTPEQVRQHIIGLRQWVGQSKAKAEKNQAMEHSMSENSCQLCAVEKLSFDPPPIYCTPCGARIKRNAMYYTCGNSDTRHYICIPCHNEARGDSIEVEGTVIPKSRLEKKRNDEETEEGWVQCDKCEAWQHQICALFNGRRNDCGQAEYTCPNCYVQEIEIGERKPLPQSAVLGADDLPTTILSDHLERRLTRKLKQERLERARHLGKAFDEVPGVEALVIRVVSSVDKKLEVKPRFLEIFQEENYPSEFPYKSKVILLFQKIQGVEVCLFGMYVQEFGSECQFPNQRRVYLSYLDSVKYFRPETRAETGEALRTFVYHEILIGYLEYCKKRGFTSCYIWACPPLKGEDYILYCHPEIQKTPKSDKLREWYLSMLRKAMKENIVADLTNLYDHFFVTMGECKAKVTAARLPYFDGDYWPGAAEDMISQFQQEEDGKKQQKKGKTKKTITKRQLKAAGQADLSGNPSKDAMLMQKLGETIYPMKEDFIMVHLQHACTHCCLLMVCGIRWVCNQCKNFQLCEKCYDAEQGREERERHPVNGREKHLFHPVEVNDVPSDTRDQDEILESEFFDTRQAFLSLCQGNHYQYDTLRRAKHSSMMVLYHLHNPTAPAFVTTCNVCHHDIEAGQGWRCEICPDFDVCNGCYQKDGVIDHPHKLTNHPSNVDAQNTEARQKRVLQLRKMLDLLVHASKCRVQSFSPAQSQCQYPNCRKVKGLFRHGRNCKVRASGGCVLCKKMWYLLQIHARACKESECSVPRCKDLKEHLRRLQQQSDSRRRAAVAEMMRQRAAEVAGGSG